MKLYQNLVYPQLPNAGLGNMLLVWAKAIAFADINSFPIMAPNWNRIRIGPLLRGEKDLRYYGNLFNNNIYISSQSAFLNRIFAHKIYDHTIEKINIDFNKNITKNYSDIYIYKQILSIADNQAKPCVYIFSETPHWSDFFAGLKEHQHIVKETLINMIRPEILESINKSPHPEIGIHLRMSDFKKLKPGDDFAKVGATRTPINWYIRVLNNIRKVAGYNIPVTIFSDGYDEELQELLILPEIKRAEKDSAIADIIKLSKSKLIIGSVGSTFSGWSAYLAQCPTIWHPDHFHATVFPEDVRKNIFEGGFDPDIMEIPELLKINILESFRR